jgi:hypothetical protein
LEFGRIFCGEPQKTGLSACIFFACGKKNTASIPCAFPLPRARLGKISRKLLMIFLPFQKKPLRKFSISGTIFPCF